MKAATVFALIFLAGCSSSPMQPKGRGRRGHSKKSEELIPSTPGYAHVLTETIRNQINSCASKVPDETICKSPDFSLYPLRSIKFALQKAGVVPNYLAGGTGQMLANELAREGFINTVPKKESDILPGSIVIYEGPGDYAEIKGEDAIYYSNQVRTGSAFEKEADIYTRADANSYLDQMIELKKTKIRFESFSVWIKPARPESRETR